VVGLATGIVQQRRMARYTCALWWQQLLDFFRFGVYNWSSFMYLYPCSRFVEQRTYI